MLNFLKIFLISLLVVINVLRFFALDKIPHGYHVDEYAAAVNLLCVAKEGTGSWGQPYYPFLHQGFGTPKPWVYTFPALLWTKIFGYSVGSVRALSVLGIVLGVIGLFVLGNFIGGIWVGLWTALAATVSPWSWVLGRLGFESFFAPVSLIWGIWFFVRRRHWLDDLGAGICFCFSAYLYPPARAFIPIFMFSMIVGDFFITKKKRSWWVLAVATILPALPLIKAQLSGELSNRLKEVAIWDHHYLETIGKSGSFTDLLSVFYTNFLKHLDPHFLFLTGDPDFTHSTQKIGLLSVLDITAFLVLVVGIFFYKPLANDNPWRKYGRWYLLCVFGFLLGIVPAALTFLDIPNALRMCLGWPFICLLTGLTIGFVTERKPIAAVVISLMVLGQTYVFLNDYFRDYPDRSKGMFSFWIYDEAQRLNTQQDWIEFLLKYPVQDYHERYYLMNKLGQGCAQSYEEWKKIKAASDRIIHSM